MPATPFHPIVNAWFEGRFERPTEPQRRGWPEILAGRHTLIAAPTGSGKSLAAFLAAIDRLLEEGLAGRLPAGVRVVYVSPLKALSNDVRRNLEVPLAEIGAAAGASGVELPPIRAAVRTGDTPAAERQAMLRRPPHILVTTPESLYLLVTAPRGRDLLRGVETVIADEIHALARDKRGSHLSLTIERLEALCPSPPLRIGLSATQKPIEEMARFLAGSRRVAPGGVPQVSIIDAGSARELDLGVEVPETELAAVCSHETWEEIYRRLAGLIEAHRSTLVFVNTRRLAERVAHHLAGKLGAGRVASHHGSLSREIRLDAEEKLKAGELGAIVATASLELGIDVGAIDLVCQIGSPRSIATFLQRIGRSGHSLSAVPRGRLFPLTRDELVECLALVRAARQGSLDAVEVPEAPLDILCQQIVAAVSAEEWSEDALYELCRGAWPYRELGRARFDAVLEVLAEGMGRGQRRGAYLHRDRLNGRLRARRGARIAALTSGGAIPETADYRVVTAGERTVVGSVNEDFAIESLAGDIFLLGNTSWRICQVRGGEVVVEDARGAPATVPFWLGEAPGRTAELSLEVSRLREEIERRIEAPPGAGAQGALEETARWVAAECGAGPPAARQAVEYIAAQKAAIGLVPSATRVVFERFFDEAGGMQLVIHAPFGARVNRAWGLALRKRFCRSFDFELQASASDNGIVLSLGPQHSFPIEQMFRMVHPGNAIALLEQALLAVPMFQIRWRWNATRALAVLRQRGGTKVPPPLQRFRAGDLLSAVFPAQTACQENQVGDIEIPDHPLVAQTVEDCLREAMDAGRWLELLAAIECGKVELLARETREPSPFSHELLNANPYAFLDGAPLEERRARAVATRRTLDVESLRDLGRLEPEAIERVRAEAWPLARDADELHDALLILGALPAADGAPWESFFRDLVAAGRAAEGWREGRPFLWLAAERWPLVAAAYPGVQARPEVRLPEALRSAPAPAEAWVALVRGRLEAVGPVSAEKLAADLGLELPPVEAALEALEAEGTAMRGRYSPDAAGIEWCERRLLARIHRLTLEKARREVDPVEPESFWDFLLAHQHAAGPPLAGREGLLEAIAQLQGFEAAAGAWESEIIPARLEEHDPAWLDELSLSGELAWGRLAPPPAAAEKPRRGGLSRAVPISILRRADLPWLLPPARQASLAGGGANAELVLEALDRHGALFFEDLLAATGLLEAQLEAALGELAALGLASADGFGALRRLLPPSRGLGRRAFRRGMRRPRAPRSSSRGGRWSRFPWSSRLQAPPDRVERWARQLLERYGVMFRDLLARESAAPPWRELVPLYRRLEARGEVRGGRFVKGVAGEQFAAASVVERLRRPRPGAASGGWTVIAAADPLNLAGILTAGPRIAPARGNALALRGGRVIALRQGGELQLLTDLPGEEAARLARALRMGAEARRRAPLARIEP